MHHTAVTIIIRWAYVRWYYQGPPNEERDSKPPRQYAARAIHVVIIRIAHYVNNYYCYNIEITSKTPPIRHNNIIIYGVVVAVIIMAIGVLFYNRILSLSRRAFARLRVVTCHPRAPSSRCFNKLRRTPFYDVCCRSVRPLPYDLNTMRVYTRRSEYKRRFGPRARCVDSRLSVFCPKTAMIVWVHCKLS